MGSAPPPRRDPPRRPPTPPSRSPGWAEPDEGDESGEAAARLGRHSAGRAEIVPLRTP